MNERIRELNMQAAEYATSVCPTHSRDWYPIQNTKFAELIIQKCAEIAQRTGALNEADFEGEMIADAIKEQFGVKE